jgi:hypothetical protein
MRSTLKSVMNDVKLKCQALNKAQIRVSERLALAKAKQPMPKPKKDKTEAKAAYARAKELGIDYNKYKSVLLAERRQRPSTTD